jgi:hypothetical protein
MKITVSKHGRITVKLPFEEFWDILQFRTFVDNEDLLKHAPSEAKPTIQQYIDEDERGFQEWCEHIAISEAINREVPVPSREAIDDMHPASTTRSPRSKAGAVARLRWGAGGRVIR